MTLEPRGRTGHTRVMIKARFEHLAFNVKDMESMAEWYCKHLGMKRVGYVPGAKVFLADQQDVVVFELYSNSAQPLFDLGGTASATMHLAFVVEDLDASIAALGAAGATVESPPTPAGDDTLTMLRDPFGLALQLVRRKTPLVS